MKHNYSIGLDFGSDSVRALVVNTTNGAELGSGIANYPRWEKGLYSNAAHSQFRHHPLDYIESMTAAIKQALNNSPSHCAQNIVGIGVDSTGSTPAPVDANGQILALNSKHQDNPNAMFVLWKDHTSVSKAERINALAHSGQYPDYTQFVGGIYSSEWFWAKAAWIAQQDPELANDIYCWVELADWIPALLCDTTAPTLIKRGVCAGGHKALWHASWGGLPDEGFLNDLHPSLGAMRSRMYQEVYTADQPAGHLSEQWSALLGIPPGVPVAIGEFDCHMGAVGAGAEAHDLVKVMGTSTCDILMVEPSSVGEKTINGICGQVLGSAVPELVALEAGQSAFGDLYAWYKELIMWPIKEKAKSDDAYVKIIAELESDLIPLLSQSALEQEGPTPLALDWHNGRRTPNANQRLTGSISQLTLGASAPIVFRSLVESTAHGAKAIQDCFTQQGIAVNRIIAIGGISKKSSFVMQICADVLESDILVMESEQCCALGAAIFGAVAAGEYTDTKSAQKAMASKIFYNYKPNPENSSFYRRRHQEYQSMGSFIESQSIVK